MPFQELDFAFQVSLNSESLFTPLLVILFYQELRSVSGKAKTKKAMSANFHGRSPKETTN